MSVKLECAFAECAPKSGDKLAAEDTAEHLDGQEEGAAGGDPAGVVRSEAAGGKHAVDMGMMLQSLVPGMEHAEEADLGSKMPGIASDLQRSCSTGVKQQVIDQPFILQCERSQFPRQGEDEVHIAGRQQLSFPRLEPAQAGVALTLGAVPVSARVVRDGSMSAVRALITMSTQRCGAAACDGQQHFSCWPLIHLRLCSMKDCPAQRTMSATSRGGRFMRSVSALLLLGWGAHPADCRWR